MKTFTIVLIALMSFTTLTFGFEYGIKSTAPTGGELQWTDLSIWEDLTNGLPVVDIPGDLSSENGVVSLDRSVPWTLRLKRTTGIRTLTGFNLGKVGSNGAGTLIVENTNVACTGNLKVEHTAPIIVRHEGNLEKDVSFLASATLSTGTTSTFETSGSSTITFGSQILVETGATATFNPQGGQLKYSALVNFGTLTVTTQDTGVFSGVVLSTRANATTTVHHMATNQLLPGDITVKTFGTTVMIADQDMNSTSVTTEGDSTLQITINGGKSFFIGDFVTSGKVEVSCPAGCTLVSSPTNSVVNQRGVLEFKEDAANAVLQTAELRVLEGTVSVLANNFHLAGELLFQNIAKTTLVLKGGNTIQIDNLVADFETFVTVRFTDEVQIAPDYWMIECDSAELRGKLVLDLSGVPGNPASGKSLSLINSNTPITGTQAWNQVTFEGWQIGDIGNTTFFTLSNGDRQLSYRMVVIGSPAPPPTPSERCLYFQAWCESDQSCKDNYNCTLCEGRPIFNDEAKECYLAPAPPAATPPPPPPEDPTDNAGIVFAIILGVIGFVVLVAVLLGICFLIRKKKSLEDELEGDGGDDGEMALVEA